MEKYIVHFTKSFPLKNYEVFVPYYRNTMQVNGTKFYKEYNRNFAKITKLRIETFANSHTIIYSCYLKLPVPDHHVKFQTLRDQKNFFTQHLGINN